MALKPSCHFCLFHERDLNANALLVSNSPPESFSTADTYPVRYAQNTWIPPSTAEATVVAIFAASLITIAPHHLPARRQLTVAGRRIAKALSNQAIHITVSSFSNHSVHFLKLTINGYTKAAPSAAHVCKTKVQKILGTKTAEVQRKLRASSKNSQILEHINILDAVATVQHKSKKAVPSTWHKKLPPARKTAND